MIFYEKSGQNYISFLLDYSLALCIGIATITLFSPYCYAMQEWLPPHVESQLTYEFWTCEVLQEDYCDNVMLLYAGDSSTMPELYLGIGNKNQNYTLRVKAVVIDTLGDASSFIIELNVSEVDLIKSLL